MNHARRLASAILLMCGCLLMSHPGSAFTLDTSATTPTNATGLWWNPSESGWGLSLTQQGTIIFAAMYTYDLSGKPTWYVASNCAVSGDGCTGDLYRVSGGQAPHMGWASSTVVSKAGSITLHFTDNNNGNMNFNIDGAWGAKTIKRQVFGSQAPPTNSNRAKTEQLLGGTWYVTYTIISTFHGAYTFSTVEESPDTPGQYFAFGTDEYGDPVIGGYFNQSAAWAILDPGTIIDRFYSFTFSDNNHIAGCYYQIDPPGSTNMSRCYSMSGYRSPAKIHLDAKPSEWQLVQEVASEGAAPSADPAIVDAYLQARARVR